MSDAYQRLRSAVPHDAWLAHDVDPARVDREVIRGGSAAWLSRHPIRGAGWVTAIGSDPALTVQCATDLLALAGQQGLSVSGFTLPTAVYPVLPARFQDPDAEAWSWWWTKTLPDRRAGEARVGLLDGGDDRLAALLAESQSAYVHPGDPRVVEWAGITSGTDLIACGAWTSHIAHVPHLASVVTRSDHRGRGLAADLCAWLIRRALARDSIVTLAMYAQNRAARRVYERLGFVCDKEFTSGTLPRGNRG